MELKNIVAFALASRTGRHLQRYDKGRRQVVGCIPYRYNKVNGETSLVDEEELEVLVITSQRKGKGMLFPKGGWESDESIKEAALRETIEEAGVVGDVERRLGKWRFKNKNDTGYVGYMFPLRVKEQLDIWPEKDTRERKWMTVAEARKVCHYGWMKEALERLESRLASQKNKPKEQSCSVVSKLRKRHLQCNL